MRNGFVSKPNAWLLAARPKTLPAAVAPVWVGTALAYAEGFLNWGPALSALAGALLIQIAVNLANDLFDAARGVDTEGRLGPVRVVQSGLISPREMRAGLFLVMALTVGIGVYLTAAAGWPVVVIGLVSLACALAYSGGPYPLASHGLGDVFVFAFFGLVAVGGTYYVQAQALSPWAPIVALPIGALATAILVVNNVRDIPTDRQAGKRTLAVMLSRAASQREYAALVFGAYLVPPLLFAWGWGAWVWLPWLTLPLAWSCARALWRAQDGPAFNALLARTAQLALAFAALLGLGLVL